MTVYAQPFPRAKQGEREEDLNEKNYQPNRLVNAILEHTGLKFDARLQEAFEMNVGSISKIRSKRNRISGEFILKTHDLTGWSIDYIRKLAGMKGKEIVIPKEEEREIFERTDGADMDLRRIGNAYHALGTDFVFKGWLMGRESMRREMPVAQPQKETYKFVEDTKDLWSEEDFLILKKSFLQAIAEIKDLKMMKAVKS